ncbi:MAG: hypothetical protein ACKO6Q_05390 [Bacteroidota bacterium]
MSHLIDNWLASFQTLPIEGVGYFTWNRQAAARRGRSSQIDAPTWELIFREDPSTVVPADFLNRLSLFANRPLPQVESEYRGWLQQFRSDEYRVRIFGVGELKKESSGPVEWVCQPAEPLPTATLVNIPFSASYLYRRWDVANWIGLALTIIGLAWTLFLCIQNGFKSEVGSSLIRVKSGPANKMPSHYQEMR